MDPKVPLALQIAGFEAMLAHIEDQALVADSDGRIVYANAAFRAFWEGRDGGDAYFERQIQRVRASGETVRDRVTWPVPASGRSGHFENIFTPLRAEAGGEINGVAIVCRNVRLEDELRESERRFSEAFANAPIGMILMKPTGEFMDANAAYLQMVGYSLTELEGRTSDHFTHPDDIANTHVYGGSLRNRQRESGQIEKRYIRKDGTILWARAAGTMRFDSAGQPLMFVAVIEDITQQKMAEEALRRSEDNLRQIFAEAPIAICVLRGPELRFDLCNPFFERLLPGRELLGRALENAVPELNPEVNAHLQTVLRTGESTSGEEFELSLRDEGGRMLEFWFTFACRAMRDPAHGQVDGVLIIAADVTSHVLARRELERANSELAEFAFVASHDLQEPLRMVNIQAQRLIRGIEKGQPSTDLLHFADEISKAAYRMADLTRDLLTYSRTKHDADLEAPAEDSDLNAAYANAAASLASAIADVGGTLRLEGTLPAAVYGNETQYSQVFHNLLSNALKYRRPDVPLQITVRTDDAASGPVISVRDNGIGFDPVYAEGIFGLFKRLHHYGEYPGTGLGLAICKRIIERQNGRIWAESQPGEGSIFYFTVTAAEA